MNSKTKILKAARRIRRVADLPSDRSPATFSIGIDGQQTKLVTLTKRRRQILEALMIGPIFSASPVRLSEIVRLLKEEHGIYIETERYSGNPKTGAGCFGVYVLKSRVESFDSAEEAAA